MWLAPRLCSRRRCSAKSDSATGFALPDRRIGVVGTLVWDTIWHPLQGEVEPREQWGGIAYSLSALAAVCPPGWQICPLVKIGEDLAQEARRFFASLRNIASLADLRIVSQPSNRVELRYWDSAERTERLSGGVAPWRADELLPLVTDLDAIFINFISGFELSRSTVAQLRRHTSVPLYADLHSLFLGPPGVGAREPRRLEDWRDWFGCFDFVQLNEAEMALTGFADAIEPGSLDLDPGPVAVLITRGCEGARVFRRRSFTSLSATLLSRQGAGGDGFVPLDVPLPHASIDGDPTGCGDVWGSVVFAALLEGRPLEEAIDRGHRAAAAKIRTASIENLAGAVMAALGAPR
ncbi:MAG: hypothetical protein GEU90_03860 [Gemmatimonas sp.]|nr:hypothetical protein [Gemmatimonas sp.]